MKFLIFTLILTSIIQSFCLGKVLNPTEQTYLFDSYLLEQKGDYPQALDKVLRILENQPNDYLVQYRLGYLFSLNKKYENAIEHFKSANQLNPKSIEALLAMAQISLLKHDYTNSIELSQKALKLAPGNYLALQRLSTGLISTEAYIRCIDITSKALQFFPTDTIFLEQKAYCLSKTNRTTELKTLVLQLYQINPLNAFAKKLLSQWATKN